MDAPYRNGECDERLSNSRACVTARVHSKQRYRKEFIVNAEQWNRQYPASEKNRFTLRDAPRRAEDIRDLGRNDRTRGATLGEPYLSRRLQFQVLLRPAKSLAEARGCSTSWESHCGLYARSDDSELARQIRVSPIDGVMRVVVNPSAVGSLSPLLGRLNARDSVKVVGSAFRRVQDTAEARVAFSEFFGAIDGQVAMAERLTAMMRGVLDAIELRPANQEAIEAPLTAARLAGGTQPSGGAVDAVERKLTDLEMLRQRLSEIEDLDLPASVWRRAEQGVVRSILLASRDSGECCICGRTVPADLLVLAHVKPRSRCTDPERRDYEHNTMLACTLGCDELFERHYIEISEGTIVQGARKPGTSDVEALVGELIGKSCPAWTKRSAGYFDWHCRAGSNGASD
jgi:hypothetical protein